MRANQVEEIMLEGVQAIAEKLEAAGLANAPALYLNVDLNMEGEQETISLSNGDIENVVRVAAAVAKMLVEMADEAGSDLSDETLALYKMITGNTAPGKPKELH